MTYGLGTPAFDEDGLGAKAATANFRRPIGRSWRALDEARRFALVERALNPANDFYDAFPLAL
jgi:hypothetical protein